MKTINTVLVKELLNNSGNDFEIWVKSEKRVKMVAITTISPKIQPM